MTVPPLNILWLAAFGPYAALYHEQIAAAESRGDVR